MNRLVLSRKYTMADQERFAELAGDFNPLHLDPVAARREFFGEPVVHGIHAVLGALDGYACLLRERGIAGVALHRLAARFIGPLYLDRRVGIRLVAERPGYAKLTARDRQQPLLDLEVEWAAGSRAARPMIRVGTTGREPRASALEELENRQGRLDLYVDREAVRKEWNDLAALVSSDVVANILALSRLVGMECPGLRSLFSSFDVRFSPSSGAEPATLSYRVTEVDSRFQRLVVAVESAWTAGTVEAFYRPAPREQASMTEVAGRVQANEFQGHCALIVGGSRGLGEVTAKILAAGGGHPVITYRHGAADAERVAAEIRNAGGVCGSAPCDAAHARRAVSAVRKSGLRPACLYYFPSPKIFRPVPATFDKAAFRRFASIYVDAFFETYRACRVAWSGPFAVFYPSSTAVDERVKGLAEYAAAKAAGETLCAYLERFDRDLRVVVKRLPRIATDQTVSLLPVPAADALDVMLPIVREMCGGCT